MYHSSGSYIMRTLRALFSGHSTEAHFFVSDEIKGWGHLDPIMKTPPATAVVISLLSDLSYRLNVSSCHFNCMCRGGRKEFKCC